MQQAVVAVDVAQMVVIVVMAVVEAAQVVEMEVK